MELASEPGAPGAGAGFARLATVDLNLLVPLLMLLEEASVTAAAERLGMSQPAMSHALQRMRRLLGDQLLVRRGMRMELTPRALELITPLRSALRQAAHVVTPGEFDPVSDRRVITIGMASSTAFALAGSVARMISQRAPRAVLRLRVLSMTEPTDEFFTHGGGDVLLLPRALPTSFNREAFYQDRWVVVTSTDAPDAPIAELIETLPHVVLDAAPYRARPYEVMDNLGLRYRIGARISDNLLIPQIVAAINGLAFHRDRAARLLVDSLPLRVLEPPFPIDSMRIDLVWSPYGADDRLRNWLGGILREAVEAGDE